MNCPIMVKRELCVEIRAPLGQIISKVRGSFSGKDKETFCIEDFYVAPGCYFPGVGLRSLQALLKTAEAKTYKWLYEAPRNQQYPEEDDPFLSLARSIPCLESHREICDRKYRVNLDLLPERSPHERFYADESLAQEGLVFLRWPSIPYGLEEQIRIILKTEPETRNLSPLRRYDWDPELSTLALYKNQVCGWMVFCPPGENNKDGTKVDEGEVMVHAWYMAKRFREKRLGIKLAAHMMRRIRKRSSRLSFFVAEYNAKAMKFYLRYFRNAITDTTYRYMLTINANTLCLENTA